MDCLGRATDWESRRLLGLSKNAGDRVVSSDGAHGELDEGAHLYAMRAAFVVTAMLENRRGDSDDLSWVATHAVLLGDPYLKDTALRIAPDISTRDQNRLGDALANALGQHVDERNAMDTPDQVVALHLGNSPDAARFVRDALELGAAVDKIRRLIVPETSEPAVEESGNSPGRETKRKRKKRETEKSTGIVAPSEDALGYLAAGDEGAVRERRAVIYVTTRREGELATSSEENIQFGKASVTFPVGRKAGEAHSGRLFGLFGRRASIALDGALAENDNRNSGPLGPDRQVLLFVHGFKTTFDEAVLRIAQVAVDSGFQGPVIVFSWPSAGKLFGYGHDDAVVRMAAPVLRQTCIELCSKCGAGRVHVLAHSMGSLLLLDALVPGRVIASPAIRLGEVVFAAPDVDREAFEVTVPMLETHAIAQRVTVYASWDRALALSKLLRLRRARAGDSVPPPPVNGERHDTIDACKIRSDFVGHSEYGNNRLVHQDLFNLLVNHQGAAQRAYLKEHDYWVDLRAKCPDRVRMFRA